MATPATPKDPLFVRFPLKANSKEPEVKFTSKDEFAAEMAVSSGNVGLRLDQLFVLDTDVGRMPPGMTLELSNQLLEANGIPIDICLRHRTGGKGEHAILRLPDGPKPKFFAKLPMMPWIDIKSGPSAYIVDVGSIHPNGNTYEALNDVQIVDTPLVPQNLLRAVTKDNVQSGDTPSGQWTPEQLALALSAYDVLEFRDSNSEWQDLMMACKHACPDGEEEFIAWCVSDECYAHQEQAMRDRWRSVTPEVAGGRTVGSIIYELLQMKEGGDTTASSVLASMDFQDVEENEEAEEATKETPSRYKAYDLDELFALPPAEWLLDHAIPQNGLVTLYGPPKSAKTFLALDIALSIGSEQASVHGFDCKEGKVLYVLAEGGAPMIAERAKAWLQHRGINKAAVKLLPSSITLSSKKDLDGLLDAQGFEWDLVIFDTLARCMEGDENAVKDMNPAIKGCDYIREKTGAAVLLVHHSGKDQSKGMRGSTALLGAVDGTIKMKPVGSSIELSVPDLRHGEPPASRFVRLEAVGGSAVLTQGEIPSAADKQESLLHWIKWELIDKTPRKEATDMVMEEFNVSEATAKRRIRDCIPNGKEKAAQYDGQLLWFEKVPNSKNPNEQFLRIANNKTSS